MSHMLIALQNKSVKMIVGYFTVRLMDNVAETEGKNFVHTLPGSPLELVLIEQ